MAIPAGRFDCNAHSRFDVGKDPFAIRFSERRPCFLNALNQVFLTARSPHWVEKFGAVDGKPKTLSVVGKPRYTSNFKDGVRCGHLAISQLFRIAFRGIFAEKPADHAATFQNFALSGSSGAAAAYTVIASAPALPVFSAMTRISRSRITAA